MNNLCKIALGTLCAVLCSCANTQENTPNTPKNTPTNTQNTSHKTTKKNSPINIPKNIQENIISQVKSLYPQCDEFLLKRGVEQCANLWRAEDGSIEEFKAFVLENYAANPQKRKVLFDKLSNIYEVFNGCANQTMVELQKPMHLDGPELENIDYILGAYNPKAHFVDDMFSNKTAFITILNFPFYTLDEKNTLSSEWTRLEWAYARMGDMFTSRIPAQVSQNYNRALTEAENYIASYNIMMGHILTEDGRKLFPEDMVLLSHWNLRDQLKSDYSTQNIERQSMISKIMEHIVCQTIPQIVINNPDYYWKPYSNKVYKTPAKETKTSTEETKTSAKETETPTEETKTPTEEIKTPAEDTKRYERILDVFHAEQQIDLYSPQQPTAIQRNFENSMEVKSSDIEKNFIELISSPEIKKVADLIKSRLGRDLQPFDIWYDGFKNRSTINEDVLTNQTRKLYPNPQAFEKNMPKLLARLGFSKEKSDWLSERIVVEGARGSGHAWGAQARWEPARLRTRIGKDGMDYKGYNIAIHEFGHNVEQTFSLYGIDYYPLAGVPNTAFTEALAFVFQKRDIMLLGNTFEISNETTLDIFWGAYEIMGVSLVDMYIWRWLYANPSASAAQLRDKTISIAKEVWNKYYEPVLGTHDSPILAIYSHIINSPMYLPNYPYGNLIEYQLERHFASLKTQEEFAKEIERIYTIGRLTPSAWMREAVGNEVSSRALIEAVNL